VPSSPSNFNPFPVVSRLRSHVQAFAVVVLGVRVVTPVAAALVSLVVAEPLLSVFVYLTVCVVKLHAPMVKVNRRRMASIAARILELVFFIVDSP